MADTLVSGRSDLALVRTRGQLDKAHSVIAEKDGTIEFLLTQMAHKVGPTISTGVTMFASGAAGFIDGFLGEENKVGPVPINLVLGAGTAIGGFLAEDADLSELLAALARGFAGPAVYQAVQTATSNHFQRTVQKAPKAIEKGKAAAKGGDANA